MKFEIELNDQEREFLYLWFSGANSFGIADTLKMERNDVVEIMTSLRVKLHLVPNWKSDASKN